MADEIVEIGQLPPELKKAKEEGAYVRVWATPDGKLQGKAYTSSKVSKEQKLKTANERLKNWKKKKAEAEADVKKYSTVDPSIHGGIMRSLNASKKKLAEAEKKIAHFEGKIKELA